LTYFRSVRGNYKQSETFETKILTLSLIMWKSSAFGLNAAILLICVVFHTKGDLDSEYKVTQVGESCRKIETVEQSEKMGREER